MWASRVFLWAWKIVFSGIIWGAIEKGYSALTGLGAVTFMRLKPDLMTAAVKEVNDEILAFNPVAVKLSAETIKQITGVDASEAALNTAITGTPGRNTATAMGDAFLPVVTGIFDVKAAQADMLDRTGYGGSIQNLSAFFGTNLTFQLRSLTISTVSSLFGFHSLRHLEGLHQSINWAFGFGWLSWAVMSEYMNTCVNPGLRRLLNSQIKHVDYTVAQAIDAFIAGYIERPLMNQVLDNDGVRDDIRESLIQLKGKDLTEGDLKDLYEHGEVTLPFVEQTFRESGYLAEEANRKTELVSQARMWALQKELVNVMETQFAHGIIQEGPFRQYLATLSYTAEEVDLEIEIAKAKATLRPGAKPKQITGTFNIAPWKIKPGASTLMTWRIHNATDVFIEGIGNVEASGEILIQPTQTQTYHLTAKSDTDTETLAAVVMVGEQPEIKRPTATLSLSPQRAVSGAPRELRWSVKNADSVTLEGFGVVEPSGLRVVTPVLPTLYTLTASNKGGVTTAQDVAFITLPSIPQQDALKPKVTFSITPGVVKAAQPQAEMKWVTTDADDVVIVLPDGTEDHVGKQGVRIITTDHSVIYTLKASNTHGTTERSEALLFQGDTGGP